MRRHGDGVRDIALWVDDAREAFATAVERGAEPAHEPTVLRDDDGEVVIAAIHTYGDTIHCWSSGGTTAAPSSPASSAVSRATTRRRSGCSTWTTASATSSSGAMNTWVKFYEDVMGFRNLISFDDKDISTEYSSLMSKVVANGNDRIKFPDQRAGRRARRSRRSTSTSSSTAAPACSTSRSPPTTSSRR